MEPVIKYMNTRHEFKTLHFVSDGPTPQYRSKFNLYLFTTQMFETGYLKGTWNFLESSHGKGAADGVGAVVKRTADKRVETNGSDITCAEDLAHELKDLNVKVFIVKGEEIDRLAEKIPKDLKSIHDIMKVHQVLVNEPGKLRSRVVSCFCKYPDECDCYMNESGTTCFLTAEKHVSVVLFSVIW
ncbi:uncharacterized protein LOC132756317 [Ruditapes philippinarum]|uniref:uncharacterized protein LOC132756317 n=1 Tax=Ruditapes philippinarum TaxID=129788 RepID=UPI00295A5B26|nr:uncharacterized protein LOC132756317 [Ruditapes philippinarum]